jgi:RNA polymerase sigma-70 factor (ECF subfamily)
VSTSARGAAHSTGPSRAPDSPEREPPDPLGAKLRAIFRQELGYVVRVLRRLGVAAADVEDAAHDTFMHVHRHLGEFDDDRPLRPWLFGFAFRVAAHRRRKTKARHESFEAPDARPAPGSDALEQLIEHERLSHAQAALEGVEVSRRAVLLAHEVEGFTMPEIAETLGISVNTAYSRLRLARQELARALARQKLRGGAR